MTPPLAAAARRAADFYHRSLFAGGPTATDALALLERRGIHEETVRSWRVGVAPEGDVLELATRAAPEREALEKLGLVSAAGDFFRERLLFPISNPSGAVVGFGGRRLRDDAGPKFLNSRETHGFFSKKRILFGLDRALAAKARRFVIVEGYLDVIACHQEGAVDVVGALTAGLTEHQLDLCAKWADDVVLVFDGDKAGREASHRAIETTVDLRGCRTSVAFLPAGMDPDEFILSRGRDAWEELVCSGRNPLDYFLDVEIAKYPADQGRLTYWPLHRLMQAIVKKSINSYLDILLWAGVLAALPRIAASGVRYESLERDLARLKYDTESFND